LCAADLLLIPCDMSVLALEGVGDMLAALDTVRTRLSRHVSLAGVLATRVDGRVKQLNAAIERSFADIHQGRLLLTRIPQSSALNKAHLCGRPVFELAPASPGAQAYLALARELAPCLGLTAAPAEAEAAPVVTALRSAMPRRSAAGA
jgi:chromosome partitioning protein